MVLVHFLVHWCSYKQLHWRNAHCLCMGSSAYQQLFKVNMQQLIRRYASQFGRFSTDSGGRFFSSPVEVWPYRRDGIAVIVRWVGYSDWSSVCGFHALPFSTLRLDRVPATISYPQKSILHPYTWSNANGQSLGSTWTNAPPFRSFPKPCKVVKLFNLVILLKDTYLVIAHFHHILSLGAVVSVFNNYIQNIMLGKISQTKLA